MSSSQYITYPAPCTKAIWYLHQPLTSGSCTLATVSSTRRLKLDRCCSSWKSLMFSYFFSPSTFFVSVSLTEVFTYEYMSQKKREPKRAKSLSGMRHDASEDILLWGSSTVKSFREIIVHLPFRGKQEQTTHTHDNRQDLCLEISFIFPWSSLSILSEE